MKKKWIGLAVGLSGVILGVFAVRNGHAPGTPPADQSCPATVAVFKLALSPGILLPPTSSAPESAVKQAGATQQISFDKKWQAKAATPDLSAYQISIKKAASTSYTVMSGVTLQDGKIHVAIHGNRSLEIDRNSPQIMLKKQF